MRAALAAKQEPIFSGYEKLRTHPFSDPAQLTREPAAEIGRNPSVNQAAFDAKQGQSRVAVAPPIAAFLAQHKLIEGKPVPAAGVDATLLADAL